MAKPTGPLLSFGASGTIGKTAVFSKWKGRPYVRQFVIPGNPQSTAQTQTRTVFSTMSDVWKAGGSLLRAPWDRFAQGQVLTGRNAFIGRNVTNLRVPTVVTDWVGSPGAKGGLAPSSVIATSPGVNDISIAFTNPSPPTGWTLQAAVAATWLQQDAHAPTEVTTVEAEDLAGLTVLLPGLTTAVPYVTACWLRWVKPDTTIAYGASINVIFTPTP